MLKLCSLLFLFHAVSTHPPEDRNSTFLAAPPKLNETFNGLFLAESKHNNDVMASDDDPCIVQDGKDLIIKKPGPIEIFLNGGSLEFKFCKTCVGE